MADVEIDFQDYAVTVNYQQPTVEVEIGVPVYSGVVRSSLFNAHTILAATVDDTPAAVTVAEGSLVGRLTGGNIQSLTAAEAHGVLGIRKPLTANKTVYVNGGTGDDSNDGTSGSPWATIQKALDVVYGEYDLSGFDITIDVAAGTYANVSVTAPQVGAGRVILSGDTTTPANVVIASTGGASSVYVVNGAILYVQGFRFTAGLGHLQAAIGGQIYQNGKIEFGTSTGHCAIADFYGFIRLIGTVNFTGGEGCAAYVLLANNGTIDVTSAGWTALGAGYTFPGAFAYSASGGLVYAFANSQSGTFTGPKFLATSFGTINSNSGNINYFPGSSAGAITTRLYTDSGGDTVTVNEGYYF